MLDGPRTLSVLESAESICRSRGKRLTPQRREVLSKLLAANGPVTAYEPVDLIRPEDPAITPVRPGASAR